MTKTKMKILPVFSIILFFSFPGFSHLPGDINLKYDKSMSELNINIHHPVYDAKTHYIKSVSVYKNGKQVIGDYFEAQQNKSGQDLRYIIKDCQKGDEITVKADCNVYGTGMKTIIVPD